MKKSKAKNTVPADFTTAGHKQTNELWRVMGKGGREKAFATPDLLWQAAVGYFEWIDANPMYEHDWKLEDKVLTEISIPHKRPFTLQGLLIYIGVNESYFRTFKHRLKKQAEPGADVIIRDADGFDTVIEQIERTIYEQKFSGAAAGFYNANIIARDLGLADKKDVRANIFSSDEPIEFE